MFDRKTKREPEEIVELDDEKSGFVLEPAQVEVGSGYAISVSYDENDEQIVDVKTYGVVDVAKLRKDIEHFYPKAQIRNLCEAPTVTVVKKRKRKKISKRKH